MQNWERSEFDEQWKDAFAGAEVTPSVSVWANVDRELTLADNNEGKRRIIFYQRLAAACVLFAVTAGTFGVYYWKQSAISTAQLNSGKTQSKSSVEGKKSISPTQAADASNSSTENKEAQLNPGPTAEVKALSKSSVDEKNSRSLSPAAGATSSSTENNVTGLNSGNAAEVNSPLNSSTNENNSSQSLTRSSASESKVNGKTALTRDGKNTSDLTAKLASIPEKITGDNNDKVSSMENDGSQNGLASSVDLPGLELLPVAEVQGEPRFTEIYRTLPYIPSAFMNESKRKNFEHEKLWASVTAASGAYTESSGSSYNSYAAMKVYNNAFALSSTPPSNVGNATQNPGSVPTLGKSYSYGVVGGVRLTERWVLQTGVQYMNQTMGSSTSQYANYGSGSLVSTNEFVSVPVQAGYLLINRKIGWQLNPGLSTDFFVRNTLANQQLSMSQGAGADSPYRSVNFAGLMSSELSYKLGKNYRLSVVPGMRYAFNPALKSMTTGGAIAWDVGFRFRYIFK